MGVTERWSLYAVDKNAPKHVKDAERHYVMRYNGPAGQGLDFAPGFDVALEMSGNAKAIDQGTRMLARGGRMSLLGLPDGPVTLDLNDQVIFKEARLQGITGREMFRTWQQTTTLLSTGRVDVTPVITHRLPMERFEEAFETTASGHSAKVIMFPDD